MSLILLIRLLLKKIYRLTLIYECFFLFLMVETYSKLGMRHENCNCLPVHWHEFFTRIPTSQHAACMTVYHDIENSIFVLFSLTLLVTKMVGAVNRK